MTIPRIATYPMPEAAALPSNRVDWLPDPKRAVLLIHDMQQYFLDFYDASAAPVPTLIAHIRQLRDACDAAGVPVVYTAQPVDQPPAHRGLLNDWWGPGITAKPELYPIVAPLAPRSSDTVLDKWRYSAFAKSDLLHRLQTQGRDQLIVCGIYAHIGVMMTVAEAFMNDIQPFLVGDAVADFSAEEHAMALSYVSRRCGVVLPTAGVVSALQPKAAAAEIPASLDALRTEVAKVLQVPASDLHVDDNLLDYGLDSIRLMSLAERWQRAGVTLEFVALAEQPTLAQWWALLSAQAR
ncbi:Isochorismatase [Andreprevotia sp. IGB-42]|uniref:isochorismatase family protein n=1 Tax=Andreprevotia sp. IGB-42 TaxID=2497473 RepID=UPI00135870B1|nr:isochorismatase family protein [Andreprevotia sp. IGB-42]KAF0812693.1 Isochorismatase [Andreprevotia sp. IGB-42]